LDAEEIFDSQGRRIDQAYVDDVVAYAHEVLTRPVGRPSLTGASQHSPQVSFRLTPQMKQQATRLAEQRGMSVSSLARQALADLLDDEAHRNTSG
jgi:predicted HicB family RNase H-like nuclease